MFGFWSAIAVSAVLAAPAVSQTRLGGFERQIDGVRDVGDVAYTREGALLAVDGVSGAVLAIDEDGTTRPAAENLPVVRGARGIASGFSGTLYLADTAMHRVLEVKADGSTSAIASLGVSMAQVNTPMGLAFSLGRLAVADAGNGRVQVFDFSRPDDVPMIFSGADAPQPMSRPVDVAIEEETGRVFAVDEQTHRVYRFSERGLLEASWGGYGDAPGLMNGPRSVAVKGGRVYVADANNHRVQVFDTEGNHQYWWGLHTLRPHDGAGRIHYPSSLALHPSADRVALGESFEDRVQVFGQETAESRALQEEDRLIKRGVSGHFGERIDADGTLLAMIEPESATVIVYDTREGVPIEITRLGGYGEGYGRLRAPADVLVDDATQRVFVADEASGLVSIWELDRDPEGPIRFSPTLGRFQRAIDLGASARYEAVRTPWPPKPIDLERGPDGSLYALDGVGGIVLVVDREGKVERFILGLGYGAEEVRAPASMCVLPDGHLAIASPHEGAVTIFNDRGEYVRRLRLGGSPYGVEADGDALLVSDRSAHSVRRVTFSGRPLGSIGAGTGVGKDDMYKPAGVAVSEQGLWILDHGNHRLIIRESLDEFRNAFGPFLYVDEANGVSAPRETNP